MGEESRTFDLGSVVAITAVPNIAEPPEATVTFVGKNADKADALAAAGPDPVATGYVVKYNDYKWSSGDYYFLIDCALGTSRGRPETMIAALTAAGFADLEMYKGILLSQIDPKHPDSLCLDGKPVFTKSQVFIPAFDILKKDDPSYGRDDVARILPMAPVSATLQGDGRAGDSGLFMTDRLAPGPSCGHILIEGQLGGGVIMYFLGELLRHPAVQLPYPDVSGSDDDDPELAAKTRIAVLGEAADKGILVAGTHLPFPGIGTVRREGEGFAFVPIDEAGRKELTEKVAVAVAAAVEARKKKAEAAAKVPVLSRVSATVDNQSSHVVSLAGDPNWDDQKVYVNRKLVGDGYELPPQKHAKIYVKWNQPATDMMMGFMVGCDNGSSYNFTLGHIGGDKLGINPEFRDEFGDSVLQFEVREQGLDELTLVVTDK